MRPEDRELGALWDMRFYAEEALKLCGGHTFETWSVDDLAIYAIEHVIQNIGEAATRVTPHFQGAHPEIDWYGIIRMRHVLVHRYETIELTRVWDVATERAAELITLLDSIRL